MNLWLALAVTVGLLAVNAFFVGAEFAIMGARRSRIEPLADAGKKSAQTVLFALENVTLMLATCQLGITVCSVALGAVSEPAIAHSIEGPLADLGVPSAAVHPIAVAIALSLVVFAHVVIGEMVPKNVAVTTPERASLVLGPPLVIVSKILHPVVASLNWVANHMIRAFGFEPKDEVSSAFTADEVASIVQVSKAAGVLHADVGLISSALEFSDYLAGDVMVPLSELAVVTPDVTPEQIELLVGQTGYSRYPVETGDGSLMGYVHLKDIIDIGESRRSLNLPAWKIRQFVSVDINDEIEAALRTMQSGGSHMATVSEEGVVRGVLFLEDILEELVGEVRDAMQR